MNAQFNIASSDQIYDYARSPSNCHVVFTICYSPWSGHWESLAPPTELPLWRKILDARAPCEGHWRGLGKKRKWGSEIAILKFVIEYQCMWSHPAVIKWYQCSDKTCNTQLKYLPALHGNSKHLENTQIILV